MQFRNFKAQKPLFVFPSVKSKLILLILLILPSMLFGYAYESFRRHSTAGIFKDDYDFLLIPEDITKVEKFLLYTAFSGLADSSYSEKILGNIDKNIFFLVKRESSLCLTFF